MKLLQRVLPRKEKLSLVNEVKQLIAESKKLLGTIEVGYLVLSTVYGLKRVEIYNIEEDSIDIDNKIFSIKPVKSTDQARYHVIPSEILSFMSSLKDALKMVKGKPPVLHYNYLFDEMCIRSNIRLRTRLGWESVRRTLACELAMSGVNSNIIDCFMGLKKRETELLLKYDWKRVDEAVFEKHPFLRFWE